MPIIPLFIVLPLALLPTLAPAGDPAYLKTLQERAQAQSLAEDPQWHRMLHYEPRRIGGGVRSDARDPAFFNAEDGDTNPEAELNATLAAFFADPDTEIRGRHPQCAFVGRFHWLDEQLDFDPERLPHRECPDFQEWRDTINAGQVTLVFADAYMNNPASMFGHTLLRLDPPAQDEPAPLSSYVVNHAAATDETSGFVFAVSGVMGWYPGQFAIMPYHEKVREYNHLESRDLWEYRLDFSEEEIARLIRHLYEVDEIAFPYYFFYKNCSYRLLAALEVARPELALTEPYDWWAIPTDTVRTLLQADGILESVEYRPSVRSKLDRQAPHLSAEELEWTRALANREIEPDAPSLTALPPERRTLILDVAYDYLEHQYRQRRVPEESRDRLHELLVARSRAEASPPPTPAQRPDTRPEEGHGTLRVGIGGGALEGRRYAALEWRAAYHDLLDPPGGYQPGAQVDFLNIEARYYENGGELELERVMAVDVESLVPRNDLFTHWSWNIRGGLEQARRPDGQRSLMGIFSGGAGWTWQLLEPIWFYASLQGSSRASSHLDDTIRIGAGPRLDILYQGTPVRVRARAESRRYHDDAPADRPDYDGAYHRVSGEVALDLARNLVLRVSAEREWDYDVRADQFRSALHLYF